jgi:putative nucleotidyltransferase with HDIG domain
MAGSAKRTEWAMLDRRDTDQVQRGWGAEGSPPSAAANDKSADQRAFRFLQEIAGELSGSGITFPTFIDATVKVRNALSDPNVDAGRLAQVVSGEPVLATKLVRMANSAALNPSGRQVADVRTAVMRVGFNAVRSTAAAVAVQQVRASKDLAPFAAEAERAWKHTLDVAAIAYVLARSLTQLNPDEALFAGLVHDIGRFYLLSRAAKYPELIEHRDELEGIVAEWHPSIGEAILQDQGLPEALVAAVANHEVGEYRFPPKTLTDVVTLANLAVPYHPGGSGTLPQDSPVFPVLAEAAAEVQSLVEALR